MLDFVRKLFSSDFLPHGYCMRWTPDLIWMHVSSDAVIALAYYIIPVALIYFVRKRRDLAFNWMFVAFGIFILACGTTHLLAIVTLWNAIYRLDGVVKIVTALASAVTAVLLVRLIPVALRIPSPEVYRAEIARRKQAESDLRRLNEELERRVKERTLQLSRYNQALQRVAYISSHDLKEPLRTVVTFTQMLSAHTKDESDPKRAELMKFIVDGCRRMNYIIDDLMDYSNAVNQTTGEPNIERGKVNVSDALEEALASLRGAIQESGIRITWDSDLPAVTTNRLHLQQLLQNLLANAVKYRSGNAPAIHISSRRDGAMQMITVRDNGIGLDMQYSEVIFEAFKRLHGPEVSGNGVGLAICKSIVESNGGHIWVESAGVGKGAAFHFTLPVWDEPAQTLMLAAPPAAPAMGD